MRSPCGLPCAGSLQRPTRVARPGLGLHDRYSSRAASRKENGPPIAWWASRREPQRWKYTATAEILSSG